nr:1-phosphofructokinase family hexose kinase [Streptomyces sp. TLI_235]
MLLVVTPNPALDVTYTVPVLRPHTTHRVGAVAARAGGKGVNVARVLTALGHEALSVLPLGGATGAAVAADLATAGLPHRAVPIAGDTRRTVAVADPSDATLFNEPGPAISPAEWRALACAVETALPAAGGVLVLSGSLPPGCPEDAYAELVALARGRGAVTVLDADGPALTAALAAGPSVVKPNAAELRAATGIADVPAAAAELRRRGAGAVVASLGPGGLYALTPTGAWRCAPPETATGNPTGAGDAAVAALAAGLLTGADWPDLLSEAVALSAAAVLAPLAGDFDRTAHRRFRKAADAVPAGI